MGVGILAKRVVLELSSSTNFVYSLKSRLTMRRDFYVAYYAFDISALTSSGLSVLLSDRCLSRCQSCNRYTER